jgi:hypothetical protein
MVSNVRVIAIWLVASTVSMALVGVLSGGLALAELANQFESVIGTVVSTPPRQHGACIVRFAVKRVEHETSSAFCSHHVGDSVTVYYHPIEPVNAAITNPKELMRERMVDSLWWAFSSAPC